MLKSFHNNILIFTTKQRKIQLILKHDSVNVQDMMKMVIRRTCACAFKAKSGAYRTNGLSQIYKTNKL